MGRLDEKYLGLAVPPTPIASQIQFGRTVIKAGMKPGFNGFFVLLRRNSSFFHPYWAIGQRVKRPAWALADRLL
jgi:hypothetical protein